MLRALYLLVTMGEGNVHSGFHDKALYRRCIGPDTLVLVFQLGVERVM